MLCVRKHATAKKAGDQTNDQNQIKLPKQKTDQQKVTAGTRVTATKRMAARKRVTAREFVLYQKANYAFCTKSAKILGKNIEKDRKKINTR